MGVDLKAIVIKTNISLEDVSGKSIAIDAYNALYQFLSIIRQPDGTPLMDNKGRITSHLSGLLYRTTNLVENGIKPIYIFDGEPPELKDIEIQRRIKMKENAEAKYKEALGKGDLIEAKKYAQMTARLTNDMVEDAKKLLDAIGIPWIQAKSEGEAQAAYLVTKGDAWAVGSQDYDSLLFGSPRLVRNLTITGKRKLPRKNVYIEISPELIELSRTLNYLGITREQLIDLSILIGTDYNPDGFKGIGPKRALELIKKHGSLEEVLKVIGNPLNVDFNEIRSIFLNPQVNKNYQIKWKELNESEVISILCYEHDFSKERVKGALQRIRDAYRKYEKQKSLESWF